MGLFDKREENLEKKDLLDLKKYLLKTDKIEEEIKNILIEKVSTLLNSLEQAKQLDYELETDILKAYINDYLNNNLKYNLDYVDYIKKVLFPFDEKTEDYEYIKKMFINKFFGVDGYLNNGIYSTELYLMFSDKRDFIDILDAINNFEETINNVNIIKEYANDILRYCLSKEEFKNELMSFILNMKTVVDYDYEEYANECLKSIKKRHGEYDIDEKKISLLNSNVEKTESFVERMSNYKEQINKDKNEIRSLINSGKKEIRETSESTLQQHIERITILKEAIEKYITEEKKNIKELDIEAKKRFNQQIEKEKEIVIKKLDERFIDIQDELKLKSDEVFSDILKQYQKQVEDFKRMFKVYSKTTSEDLLKIQKAAEESVTKLQEVVENEPHLTNLLSKVKEENTLRTELLELMQKQQELGLLPQQPQETIIVPGKEKIVVPGKPQIIIPSVEVNTQILDVFDEKISFQKRIEKVLRLKEEKEAKGELYHEKTEEVLRCIIEGDWVYMYGPSGCGKSHLIEQLGELLGLQVVNNGKIGDTFSIMGYRDANSAFVESPTYTALVHGKLLAYDEFDNGNSDTQVVINEIYSKLLSTIENPNKKYTVTFANNIPAVVNPNFRIISAGNTSGNGEDRLYSSRSKIDESVQERMTPKFITYDNRVEQIILKDYKEWYDFFVSFRKACDEYAQRNGEESASGYATTRDASNIAKYIKHGSKTLAQIIAEKFIQTKNAEYLETIGSYIENKYNIKSPKRNDVQTGLDKIKVKTIAEEFVYQCREKNNG